MHFFVNYINSLNGNNIGEELGRRCFTECEFNRSLPALRSSFCVPLVALVHSSRTNAFVAKCILVMLGSNGRKLIQVFEATLFPRLQDDEKDI